MEKMTVEMWPVGRLVPYARNPRKNDEAVPKVAGLIREFGFKVPIVARSDGSVVDGHLRLKAAIQLGLPEVPVVLCDDWTEAQVKAFRIAVNKSTEWASWDDELLKLELEDLKELDFSLDLIGFDISAPLEKDGEQEGSDDAGESGEEEGEGEFFAKKRLILVYTDEEEMFVRKLLFLPSDESIGSVYEAADIAARAEEGQPC